MYQNTCGAAAAGAGVCAESDREYHGLIPKEPQVPAIENDYVGFDVVKATQVKFHLGWIIVYHSGFYHTIYQII